MFLDELAPFLSKSASRVPMWHGVGFESSSTSMRWDMGLCRILWIGGERTYVLGY